VTPSDWQQNSSSTRTGYCKSAHAGEPSGACRFVFYAKSDSVQEAAYWQPGGTIKNFRAWAVHPGKGGSAEVPSSFIQNPGRHRIYLIDLQKNKPVELGFIEIK
jgi:hypothetical protein